MYGSFQQTLVEEELRESAGEARSTFAEHLPRGVDITVRMPAIGSLHTQ